MSPEEMLKHLSAEFSLEATGEHERLGRLLARVLSGEEVVETTSDLQRVLTERWRGKE